MRGDVPDGDYTVPLGEAKVVRGGSDVTLVAYSRMTIESLKAAQVLATRGIEAEVVDLRTLSPLDMDTVAASVEKTGRAVVVCEDCLTGGISAEVMARIVEECFDFLQAPVKRVAALDTPLPCADVLERQALPDAAKIVAAVEQSLAMYP